GATDDAMRLGDVRSSDDGFVVDLRSGQRVEEFAGLRRFDRWARDERRSVIVVERIFTVRFRGRLIPQSRRSGAQIEQSSRHHREDAALRAYGNYGFEQNSP